MTLGPWTWAVLAGAAVWALAWWVLHRQGVKAAPGQALVIAFVVTLLVGLVGPRFTRSHTISKIEQAEQTIEGLRGELRATRSELEGLRQRIAARDRKLLALEQTLTDLQARDRRLAERRQELDQVQLPPSAPVRSQEEALAVFRRYQR